MSDEMRRTCRNCASCLMTPDYADAACAAKPIENADRYGFNGYAEIDMENFGDVECCDEWKPRLDAAWNARAERTCRKVPGKMHYGQRRPKCSECGYGLGDDRWGWCPKCGAKIEEVE